MNNEKCVVPNCSNSAKTGIIFPEQTELKEKWLKSLGIPDFVPTSTSFVCLNHFNNDSSLVGDNLQNALEELPIPTISPTVQKQSSEEAEEDTCRLCSCKNPTKNVFDEFNSIISISMAINQCIPLIVITENDLLSKLICTDCSEKVKSFYEFRNICLESKKQQKEQLRKKAWKRKHSPLRDVTTVKKVFVDPSSSDEDDLKFKQVKAELMQVLKDKLPDDLKSADNIIFQVQSDEEDTESVSSDTNVIKCGKEELKLPKDIKVSLKHAKIGSCEAKHITGLYNTEFCLVDNYLFEYRLQKGLTKYLKCVISRCRSVAEQKVGEDGELDSSVLVKVAHNHATPTEDDVKKQMFLHVMRRKMQTDKSLQFRQIYEDVCKSDPEIKKIVPLKSVINQICGTPASHRTPTIHSFKQFYDLIEDEDMQRLHFTQSNKQFYQEKFTSCDGGMAVVFANRDKFSEIISSKIMYVDASFKIDTKETFQHHLLTVLVWVEDSFYPVLFALVNQRSQEIYRTVFKYLHDSLAPNLQPDEIVTDYEASLYYSLAETYLESHIGGSVFYYAQNLYKKICTLSLSHELESNSCFRNIYHMILMLPLLPVNTISDGLLNVETQANDMNLTKFTRLIFEHVKSQWMQKVTPELFCVHRLENRINENVIAPFKKLRDFLMLSKGKVQNQQTTITTVVEKLIELEGFLQGIYSAPTKKSFARDLSSSQKKNVIRAWQFIESHPKININNFFTKVLGYIKCMENQLWIWGFYRYKGGADDELINAANFSIINQQEDEVEEGESEEQYVEYVYGEEDVVMDVVIDEKDGFLVKDKPEEFQEEEFVNSSMTGTETR